MKHICNVDLAKKDGKFQPYRSVVEVKKGKNFEVDVVIEGYSEKYIAIVSGPIEFNVKTLEVSCSHASVPEVLLHIELCKFIFDMYPELAAIKLG